MAWRPHLDLIDGELSNRVPGKVTGWMRFFRSGEQPLRVVFDLEGDFHEDIRGSDIVLKNDEPADKNISLSRAGQRIGDWNPVAGRHGILGMELQDVDRKRRFITVRLKGARDQHRVPVTDDFWPIYEEYLRNERRAAPDVHAVWIASRKGRGKPLRYASFESALRYIGRRAGISVHPHLFRHTLAQGVLETTGNIKVAQEILGHSHLSTTADLYLRVDQHAMVTALVAAKSSTERATTQHSWPSAKAAQYVFDYDDETISELERTIAQASGVEPSGGDF